MIIKYTGYELITVTVNNVFCPKASAYWYTGSLSPQGSTYIVNGILDDGNNSTSDDFSYNTELKTGFTTKFKTVQTLYSTSHKPTYVWSYISLLPKFDNTLYGKLTKSTTYIEVRERATGITLNNLTTNNSVLSLTYPNSINLTYTLYPTNCYHKNVVFKQKYGYTTIVNNTLTPIKVGIDTVYCYSRENNNNDALLGYYRTNCAKGSQTTPTINLNGSRLNAFYPNEAYVVAEVKGFYDQAGGAEIYWENGYKLTTIGTKQTRCYVTSTTNYNASSWSNYVSLTVHTTPPPSDTTPPPTDTTPPPTSTPSATPTPTPSATPTPTPTPTPIIGGTFPPGMLESLTAGDGVNNGHNYVDLGLPSGTKWATCNVGANLATSDGLLFQFGKTDGYAYGDTNNTFTAAEQNEELTGNAYINPTTSGAEYIEGQKLSLADDMARANMGGDWIMPTHADLQELYNYTTINVMTITGSGKKGMLFTSKLNGKSIFVVFSGYWMYNFYNNTVQFYAGGLTTYLMSSEVVSSSSRYTYQLLCDSDGNRYFYESPRAFASSVRGVLKV